MRLLNKKLKLLNIFFQITHSLILIKITTKKIKKVQNKKKVNYLIN